MFPLHVLQLQLVKINETFLLQLTDLSSVIFSHQTSFLLPLPFSKSHWA